MPLTILQYNEAPLASRLSLFLFLNVYIPHVSRSSLNDFDISGNIIIVGYTTVLFHGTSRLLSLQVPVSVQFRNK